MARCTLVLGILAVLGGCAGSGATRDLTDASSGSVAEDFAPRGRSKPLLAWDVQESPEWRVGCNVQWLEIDDVQLYAVRLGITNRTGAPKTVRPKVELVDAAGTVTGEFPRSVLIQGFAEGSGGGAGEAVATAGNVAAPIVGFAGAAPVGLAFSGIRALASAFSSGSSREELGALRQWALIHWLPEVQDLEPGQTSSGVRPFGAPKNLPITVRVTLGPVGFRFRSLSAMPAQ